MAKNRFLRNFLVGSERIVSKTDYKEALLRGQFGILIGGICSMYIVIDLINNVKAFIPYYFIGVAVAAIVVLLNRNRQSTIASVIILVFSNLLVYVFAAIDSPFGGVFLYFTATASGALILFSRHHKYLGYTFVSLSIALGIIAFLGDWSFVTADVQTETYGAVSFITNFVLGLLTSVLIIRFAINRNIEAEKSLMNNIRARENAEESLMVKNEELQKANEELDRFVYSASHDMRAPLSSLLGLLEIVRLTNKDTELREYFELMKKRILTMEGFIKEVTDYSRNTRMEVNLEEVNLNQLVIEIIESIEFLSTNTIIRAKNEVPEDFIVSCDLPRVRVILSNLMSNCIKYHDVQKEENMYTVTAKRGEKEIIIQIADNGIGIEHEHQNKIFNMFFRATELSEGSGLGLYIVKETVNKLGGRISFESTPGMGSTFTVVLPTVKIAEDAEQLI